MQQDLFVQTMHTENDLLKDMEAFGSIMVEDAEDQILESMLPWSDEVVVLAGASVHFDRSFIRNWMPRLDRRLLHRHMDVSTLRMFLMTQASTLTVKRCVRQFTEHCRMSRTHTACTRATLR